MSIYGQTEQSGVIRCGNNRIQFANFNMYGGNILSTGDVTATVETNFVRGTLEAAYFTGTQGFSFSGGNLKADRCVTNIDNRLGWTNLSDSIRFNNINTVRYGTFTIADGQAFTDGENIYTGVLAPEQVSTMQGKTLTPYQLHHFGDPDIQTVFVRDVEPTTLNGKQYYVFKCHVAAKEMTSEISAQMFDGDQASREYSYSVKEYGDWLLAHSDLPEFAGAVPLVKAMLNYGAYAQIYFDKNPQTLANANLEKAEKELGNIMFTAPESEIDLPTGVTFKGATLSLKSETTLSLYFKSDETLVFGIDGKKVETVASGTNQVARIRGIASSELQDSFTLTVTAGETSGTVKYSPMNYCHNALNGGKTNDKLINAVKALYLYSQAAKEYFKPNQDGN